MKRKRVVDAIGKYLEEVIVKEWTGRWFVIERLRLGHEHVEKDSSEFGRAALGCFWVRHHLLT